jgi:Predicted integral membrane protein
MKKKLITAASWLPAVLCMAAIFLFSSQKSEASSETSGGILNFALKFIQPLISDLSDIEQFNITETIHIIIRKIAHATIYMILAALFSNALYVTALMRKTASSLRGLFDERKVFLNSLTAFLLTVLYAASDEIHQTFVDGRSGELRDVLIDSSGALVGVFLYLLIIRAFVKRSKKRG